MGILVLVLFVGATWHSGLSQEAVEEEVRSLNREAVRLYGENLDAEAIAAAKEALTISREKLGKHHPLVAESLNVLALSHHEASHYEEAERLYKELISLYEDGLESDLVGKANAIFNLGCLYIDQSDFERGEGFLVEAVDLRKKNLGERHPETVLALNNLAFSYFQRGAYDKAEPLFEQVVDVSLSESGTDSVGLVALNNLAFVYEANGKKREANELQELVLALRKERLGGEHLDTAVSLEYLAGSYERGGDYEKAEVTLKKVLAIRIENLGENHPDTALILSNLASLNFTQGKYEEADRLQSRATEILEQRKGPTDLTYSESLLSKAAIQRELGNTENSNKLILRGLKGIHQLYENAVRYFPVDECLALRKAQLSTTNAAGNSGDGEVAAREQVRFKGMILEGVADRRFEEQSLRQSQVGRSLLEKRDELQEELNKRTLEEGGSGEGVSLAATKLSEVEKEISRLLRDEGESDFATITLEDVQGALAEDEVLVESFRYAHRLNPKEFEVRYASVLIRSVGKPEYVSHGHCQTIDVSRSLYYYSIAGDEETGRAYFLSEGESGIQSAYLGKLEKFLNVGEKIIFSLEGQLHFLPLGMVRDEDGELFGSRFGVRYVNSGRDLVKESRKSKLVEKTALLLGNPSFRDNRPLQAIAAEEEEAESETADARSGIQSELGSVALKPLPGTIQEVSRLGDRLETNGYSVSKLTSRAATEEGLIQSIDGQEIIHLATHGFLLNDPGPDPRDRLVALLYPEQESQAVVNDPMYRSGLALSGAQSTVNLWKEGKVPPPSSDGVLLAAEANLLDLRGTDLVVLSACDTAKGEAVDGEGVMGLRRAFASAGANSTIMTLWPVNDESTAVVMDVFYEKYLGGMHPAVALQDVQMELYEPFVEKYGEVEAIARLAPFVCMSVGRVPHEGGLSSDPETAKPEKERQIPEGNEDTREMKEAVEPASEEPSLTVTIRSGDSLSEIAEKYGTTVSAILDENVDLDDPNRISIGQEILMPSGSRIRSVTVQSGDSLQILGARHRIPWRELAKENDIEGPDYLIHPGQVLQVPPSQSSREKEEE